MTPLLDIESYFFIELNVKTNPDYGLQSDGHTLFHLTSDHTECSVTHSVQKDRILGMQIGIRTKNIEDVLLPYEFNVIVFGTFVLADSEKVLDEKIAPKVLQDATHILYGVLREKINSLTCQFPFGPVILPIQYFMFQRSKKENT